MKKILALTVSLVIALSLCIPAGLAADIRSAAKSEIDVTYKDKGLVKVKSKGSTKALKVKIEKSGATAYAYDLKNNGAWESYPLQSGDGSYTIKVLELIEGNRYSVGQTETISVKLTSSTAPFLNSVQNINFSSTSEAVKKAASLASGAGSDLKKVEKIYQFVTSSITYDKDKASKVAAGALAGYVPAIDTILKSKKGICFDYSSLMASMLRSQGVPTRMVFGYVAPNNVYHAWNEVYIKGTGWVKINGSVYFDGKSYSRMDSTFAAGNKSGGLSKFMGNGSNYQNKYIY